MSNSTKLPNVVISIGTTETATVTKPVISNANANACTISDLGAYAKNTRRLCAEAERSAKRYNNIKSWLRRMLIWFLKTGMSATRAATAIGNDKANIEILLNDLGNLVAEAYAEAMETNTKTPIKEKPATPRDATTQKVGKFQAK